MRDKVISVIMWLVASLIALMALGVLMGPFANNILGFLIVLLSAIMFTPLIQKVVRVKTKKEIKPEMYLLTGCLLFLAGLTVSIGDNEQIKETNEKIRAINEENGSREKNTDKQEPAEDEKVKEGEVKVEEISQPEPVVEEPEILSSNWEYNESEDEMRGATSYFASNESINTVELQFPYQGGTRLNILLRDNAKHGKDIMFIVNKGQIFCGYQDCHVNIKFDDGEVQRYETTEAEAGSSEVLFLTNNIGGFVKKLKNSKTVTVEVNFYNHGAEQFKFDVYGLEWSHF